MGYGREGKEPEIRLPQNDAFSQAAMSDSVREAHRRVLGLGGLVSPHKAGRTPGQEWLSVAARLAAAAARCGQAGEHSEPWLDFVDSATGEIYYAKLDPR